MLLLKRTRASSASLMKCDCVSEPIGSSPSYQLSGCALVWVIAGRPGTKTERLASPHFFKVKIILGESFFFF